MVMLVVFSIPARADLPVTTLQTLDFGKWIIAGNRSPGYITVQTNGSYNSSGNVIMLEPPQYGIFRIGDLPVNSTIASITVTTFDALSSSGGGEDFVMDNFSTEATNTDINGETTVKLGMTLRTSGNSQPYNEGDFNGTVQLEFNF